MYLNMIKIKVPSLKGFNKKVIDRSQQAGAADNFFLYETVRIWHFLPTETISPFFLLGPLSGSFFCFHCLCNQAAQVNSRNLFRLGVEILKFLYFCNKSISGVTA